MKAFHSFSLFSSLCLLGIGLLLPVSGGSNPYSYGAMPTGQFPPLVQPSSVQYAAPPHSPHSPPYGQRQGQQAYSVPNYLAYSTQTQTMPYQNMQSRQRQPAYSYNPYQQQQPPRQMNYQTPTYQFSNMTPFGNSFSPTNMFNNNNFPSPWQNSGQWNPWKNGNNSNTPFFPNQNSFNNNSNKNKAWGDTRNIWPDFYTGFTEEFWDQSSNAPYDMGRMPGGWRAPSLSSPDPITVGDAVLNQFPPIMEEMGNMMDFSNNN